ncbi:MAG: methyltransferase domain-containing protein [Thermoleophilia bacterium]|nr:methyltransferase domain-containing protein [Thermoleophilia bacterium]
MSLSDGLSEHARRNRAHWDTTAAEYQERHGAFIGRPEPRWGIWQLPESELQILGDVSGNDVLELGCGAAQWSILLAQRGARPVGLDNSERQLEHARTAQAEAGVEFPLVHASAESVPLRDASFDVVFCDHGAFGWADPRLVMPEAARVLRPGGLLAFCITGPLASLCWHPETGFMEPVLHRDYFALHRLEDEQTVNFQLPYSEWLALFRDCGLEVERLVEPQPPPDATSTYWEPEELEWARRWPSECIWTARKR